MTEKRVKSEVYTNLADDYTFSKKELVEIFHDKLAHKGYPKYHNKKHDCFERRGLNCTDKELRE